MSETARQDRQQEILDAADRLFGERGFAGVSMRDIAEAAGVNKALVFYYFGGKEPLFEAVLRRYYAAHTDVLEAAFEIEAPIGERMHRGIDAYLDFIEANQRYARLVQGVITSSPDHHPLIQANLAGLYEAVSAALVEVTPTTGPLAPRHFFVTLSAAVINYFTYADVLESIWDGDPGSPEALVERRAHIHWLVDALLAALPDASEP